MLATIINPLENRCHGRVAHVALHAFLPRSIQKARESFDVVVDESSRYVVLSEMFRCYWHCSNNVCLKVRAAA